MNKSSLLMSLPFIFAAFGCNEVAAPQEGSTKGEIVKSEAEINNITSPFEKGEVLIGNSIQEVEYQQVDSLLVVEGDILVKKVNPNLARSVDEVATTGRRNAISSYWKSGVVPYVINSNLTNTARVTDAIAYWQQTTGLRFVPRNGESDYLEFVTSTGCWSFVGRQGGRQELGLATGCSTGNTIHEIGHTVGLWHEQSRSDRDTYINVDWNNIQSGYAHNFYTYLQSGSDGFEQSAMDFGSIMIYGSYAFASDATKPTMTKSSDGSTWVGQRTALSAGDIGAIHRMYANVIRVAYQAHVQGTGWMNWVSDGEQAGTTGQSLRMEAFRAVSSGLPSGVSLQYRAYVEGVGWQSWGGEASTAGVTGQSKRIEALQFRLSDSMTYTVQYRAQIQDIGWTSWASNAAVVGTAGSGKRVEAIEVKIIRNSLNVYYQVYLENIGWQEQKSNGMTAGTLGQSLRMEAIKISATGLPSGASIQYRTHLQDLGWGSWVSDGAVSGTTGQSRRVEAIQVRLVGAASRAVDYQTYVQDLAWGEWVSNGSTSGTTGQSLRVEAIRINIK